jgi:glycosyltransferase involved in cell wall biosynthesis
MNILVLCSNSATEASMRFRVLQFIKPLLEAGHRCRVSSFFPDNSQGWGRRVAAGFLTRIADVARARRVDRILVHREIMPLGLNGYVRFMPSHIPLVYDFDDAVHLASQSGWRGWLARPRSTDLLVTRADLVLAGNSSLAEYAGDFNDNVRVVPTVVDTDRFQPRQNAATAPVPVLGWVGSPSTARYLDMLVPALAAVRREIPFRLRIVGAGRDFQVPGVETDNLSWRLEEEVEAFQAIDIGLYPLHDDPWARGKCGFKAIQYMACGIPFVVTPVGVVADIVRPGVDGLWADSTEQWISGLRTLLQSPELCARLAASGRQRVVDAYSVAAHRVDWISALENVRVRPRGSARLPR